MIRRIPFIGTRPVVAAVVASGLSLALIGVVAVAAISHKPVAVRTSPTPLPTFYLPSPSLASAPYSPTSNPVSAPYSPTANPASGPYPPFYPPASGSVHAYPSLDCRLPVFAGPPGSGGFIVFPGGTFIADPTSSVTAPSPSPGSPSPSPAGPGYGAYYPGLSYDRQYSRWVPAPFTSVSPDGSRYAYASTDGIYVVSVANGTQTEVGEGHSWTIVGVQTEGVYAGNPGVAGLWLLPFSGTPRQITQAGYWQAATSVAAYGTTTSAVPQGATNAIIRLDLKTGISTQWFTRPGTESSVAGFDGKGNPIIYVRYLDNSRNEIWIATGATSASVISGSSNGRFNPSPEFNANGTPVADSHGVWFPGNASIDNGSSNGVALYVAGSGIYWMSSIGGQLAGGCY